MRQYWVVGATWGDEDKFEEFIEGGYWALGFDDDDQRRGVKHQIARKNQIQAGDLIAIKIRSPLKDTIVIRAVGIVEGVDPDDRWVYVDWVESNLDREVRSFSGNDEWTKQVFKMKARPHDKSEVGESVLLPPQRMQYTTTRIIRDTAESRLLKAKHEYMCQICCERIELGSGSFYTEVHHIRPLGGRHRGLDTQDNMLVVCPTHHAMFDLGAAEFPQNDYVTVCGKTYKLILRHRIALKNIRYHNTKLVRHRE